MSDTHQAKYELASAYFVEDRHNKQELHRLALQDQMLNSLMGGLLPEQPHPSRFQRVLDVACGTGGWVLAMAKEYSEMQVIGIDISRPVIEYAREQAKAAGIADRVKFAVMDALLFLEFPPEFFDLVNLRLGGSFLRIWEWQKLVGEMLRVCRRNGIIRVTECESGVQSSSSALIQLFEMGTCAMFQSGRLFEQAPTGLTAHLARVLTQYGVQQVQTKVYPLEYRAGTSEGQAFQEDMRLLFQTGRPFVKKWGRSTQDYDAICQRALDEMLQPDFCATWNFLAVWGTL